MNYVSSWIALALLLSSVPALGLAQPQPAPPPRELTKAELIVGRWRLEKLSNDRLRPEYTITAVFERNGLFTTIIAGPNGHNKTSRYTVDGNTLTIHGGGNPLRPNGGISHIRVVDRSQLILEGRTDGAVGEFVRLPD